MVSLELVWRLFGRLSQLGTRQDVESRDASQDQITTLLLLQYEPADFGALKQLKDPPVNPKGSNILATIEALRQTGYDISLIKVNPGPPDPQGRDIITEQQLVKSPQLEYLAFSLSFHDNNEGLDYLRIEPFIGGHQHSNQYSCELRFGRTTPSQAAMKELTQIVQQHVFDYEHVGVGPVDRRRLPNNRY